MKKGDYIYNMNAKKRLKVSRMVRIDLFAIMFKVKMHANEMEDINSAEAGDIFAIFGVECSSGDSLVPGEMNY